MEEDQVQIEDRGNDSEDNYEEEFEDNVVSPQAEKIEKIKKLVENYDIDESKPDDQIDESEKEDEDEDEYEEDNYDEDDFEQDQHKVNEDLIPSSQINSMPSSQTGGTAHISYKNSAPIFLNEMRSASQMGQAVTPTDKLSFAKPISKETQKREQIVKFDGGSSVSKGDYKSNNLSK